MLESVMILTAVGMIVGIIRIARDVKHRQATVKITGLMDYFPRSSGAVKRLTAMDLRQLEDGRFTYYDYHGESFEDPLLPARLVSEILGRTVMVAVEHSGNGHFTVRVIGDEP